MISWHTFYYNTLWPKCDYEYVARFDPYLQELALDCYIPHNFLLLIILSLFFSTMAFPNFLLSFLEEKMQEMEDRHREELEEKSSLQALVSRQSSVIRELEAQLSRATGNSTALQRQQQDLMDTVRNLLSLCAKDGGTACKYRSNFLHSFFSWK